MTKKTTSSKAIISPERDWDKLIEAIENKSLLYLEKLAEEPYGQKNLTADEVIKQIMKKAPNVDTQVKRLIGDLLDKWGRP
ncbi:MAG: hypothetical protein KatS3mg087_1363 [Patescibacteria group bacterium]|nr:MAG: hypothetical protein KatS3mg087_1363 [Patescibacteria group bacterium]